MLLRASLLFFLISSSMSHAGLFGDNEAREQINMLRSQMEEMEARMTKIEEILKNQALIELYAQAETLSSELGNLRGQLEILNNENELLQKRQKDFYIDLDNRLQRIEQSNTPVVPESQNSSTDPIKSIPSSTSALESPSKPVSSAIPAPSGKHLIAASSIEKEAYEKAYNQFKNGDYTGAISQFEVFLSNYPMTSLAPAAAYWIGNAYYALRDFQKAIDAQKKLISTYPDSNKAPDALLNIASSQQELANTHAAKATLESLIARYPHSDAVEKAKQRLAHLK